MKLKSGFVLREVAGEIVALPTGGVTNMDMMITLNDTGRFIWSCLETGAEVDEIVDAILKEYDVSREIAERAVLTFCEKLKEHNFLEE